VYEGICMWFHVDCRMVTDVSLAVRSTRLRFTQRARHSLPEVKMVTFECTGCVSLLPTREPS
jgi:hypothetical protein